MSKVLSFQEFAEIVNYISAERSMVSGNYKFPLIKYIDPTFDMRTNSVFNVKFRGGYNKEFSSTNENRYLKETMYERIMQWLNTPKEV